MSDRPCQACSEELTNRWRQCGAGCDLVIAYCEACGGDELAKKEMVEHMAGCKEKVDG